MKKSIDEKTERKMTPKLVETSKNHNYYNMISVKDHTTDCKFYMRKLNETPKEFKINSKYGNQSPKTQENRSQIVDVDDYVDIFISLKQKECKGSFANLISTPGIGFRESKYDPGPNIPYPKEKCIKMGCEIELTENTFSISSLPGSIAVKWDEQEFETVRRANETYAENCARDKTDSDTQTVRRKSGHVGCQTDMYAVTAVGTQCHGFDIADALHEAAGGERTVIPVRAAAPRAGHGHGLRDRAVFVERTLARNALDGGRVAAGPGRVHRAVRASAGAPDDRPSLEYCFAMDPTAVGRPAAAVSCVHWNHAEIHMVAVGYGGPVNAVAVWSVKNPHAPERFYEFGEMIITCLKFSVETPSYLAVGFEYGDLLIIDVSSENLEIVARLCNQLSLKPVNVVDMFWTMRIDDKFTETDDQGEFLLKCGLNGCVVCYRQLNNVFAEKTIMDLFDFEIFMQTDQDSGLYGKKSICSATKIIGLNQNTYVVGTADGWLYSCLYENPMKHSTRTKAHFGLIKSLEKSPYSWDVFLTTGCDFKIKIWVGDFFTKSVITLLADRPIEKAIWSRTNSTIIVSVNDDCIQVWDIGASVLEPQSVYKSQRSDCKFTGIEFSSDGKHLCATDTGGRVVVYAWSDVPRPRAAATVERQTAALVEVIVDTLHDQPRLSRSLSWERPVYAEAFSRRADEKAKRAAEEEAKRAADEEAKRAADEDDAPSSMPP